MAPQTPYQSRRETRGSDVFLFKTLLCSTSTLLCAGGGTTPLCESRGVKRFRGVNNDDVDINEEEGKKRKKIITLQIK